MIETTMGKAMNMDGTMKKSNKMGGKTGGKRVNGSSSKKLGQRSSNSVTPS